MTACTWATEADKHDLIDFIDYVFSRDHRPHNFASLLPKLYGKQGDAAAHHVVVREDGRIVATLTAYPVTMHIAGEDVPTLGIGSVSVHPRYRGHGYLSLMMDAVDARAAATGTAFAVLSGQRQRYGYYGYEKAGLQLRAELNGANVHHALRHVDTASYTLVPMTDAHVPAAAALHAAQPCFSHRPAEKFIDILRSWEAQPVAILHGGEMIGYAAVSGAHVGELLLADEAHTPAALKLLHARFNDLMLYVAPWETQRAELLTGICESFAIRPDHLVKFYQPERVKPLLARLGSGDSLSFCGFTPPLPLYISSPDTV